MPQLLDVSDQVSIFFEGIETFCPICGEPVKKVVESNRKSDAPCQNEFFSHQGRVLTKFKNPKGAWELTKEYTDTLSNSKLSESPGTSGQI
jgi:uncharacterized Zn finger protein (UPF0148 family)